MRPIPLLLAACSASQPVVGAEHGPLTLPDLPVPAVDSGDPDTDPDTDTDTDTTLSPFEACFSEFVGDGTGPSPDYDQYAPTIGSHCNGTNHQDIAGIERVVFLGDSITVGTPPTGTGQMYRNLVADALADRFGLEPPSWAWQNLNLIDGTTLVAESGAFASCAKWGARADDLIQDNDQILDCFPEDQRSKRTLVVMTVGGNDLASLAKGFLDGKSTDQLWDQTREFVGLVRDAIAWLKEPGRFPNGIDVVFTNLYEFTDGTGDVTACPAAGLAGFGAAVEDPALAEMVVWSMEGYLHAAVDHQADMLFLLEQFCGHGFNHDDPMGRCYRGPDAELWFDLTCIHPNPTGHRALADMVLSVVDE